MTKWQCLTDEQAKAVWDKTLARFEECSPFQSYAWGEYRRGLGWKPYRFTAVNAEDKVVAMVQACLRKYPFGVGLAWAEGGPIGDLSACDENFQQAAQHATGLRRIYFRCRSDRRRSTEDSLKLSALSWTMPWSPLVSNYTMTVDLSLTEAELLSRCERNWRRNLKRSQECGLIIRPWQNPSADEVLSIYDSMQTVKGIEEQHSRAEIEELIKRLGKQLVLLRCQDEQGQLLSLMGCILAGNNAVSVLSATSERGRELHSSYAIFWAMLQHCRNLGIISYDLAGIDPVRNPGVFRFKRASGATPVELLGEWDWASRPWLRWFGNWAIGQRRRVRQAETLLNRAGADLPQNNQVTGSRPAQVQFGES